MPASELLRDLSADPVLVAGVGARMLAAVGAGILPVAHGVGIRVVVALAATLTAAALPMAVRARAGLEAPPAVFLVVGEALVGLALGAAVAAVLAAASWAGSLLGSATGLAWADELTSDGDPQAAGMARLAWWLGLAGFLAAGGHLAVVAGLVDSVVLLPVGGALAGPDAGAALVSLATGLPALALGLAAALAAPALAAVIVCHVAASVCARTARFDPGQGLLQAVAAVVLMAGVCLGAESWLGGFAAAVRGPIEQAIPVR